VRTLAGPTNPAKAAPGTIRADFGTDVMLNAVHASDSPEAAVAELARFGLS
jgi:nucleoside-diphosphate kinase